MCFLSSGYYLFPQVGDVLISNLLPLTDDVSHSEMEADILPVPISEQPTRVVVCIIDPGWGTDLERGYGDVRPRRLKFHASHIVHKCPSSNKKT